jgi:hypothetical protein
MKTLLFLLLPFMVGAQQLGITSGLQMSIDDGDQYVFLEPGVHYEALSLTHRIGYNERANDTETDGMFNTTELTGYLPVFLLGEDVKNETLLSLNAVLGVQYDWLVKIPDIRIGYNLAYQFSDHWMVELQISYLPHHDVNEYPAMINELKFSYRL